MKAKEYLKQIQISDTKIQQAMNRLYERREAINQFIAATKPTELSPKKASKAVEVYKLCIKGYSDVDIAKILGISDREAASYRLYYFDKLHNAKWVASLTDKYQELSNSIDRQIEEFVDKQAEIIGKIQSLSDTRYSELLYKNYVEYKDLHTIAEEMNYSYNHIRKLKGEALEALQQLIL